MVVVINLFALMNRLGVCADSSGCGDLGDRTIFNAGAAAGAQFLIDAAGALAYPDFEIPRFSLNFFQVRVRDQFDI
jgi:hypothetical protein